MALTHVRVHVKDSTWGSGDSDGQVGVFRCLTATVGPTRNHDCLAEPTPALSR